MTDRICPECGAAFMPRYGSQVCCSDKCQAARRKQLRNRQKQASLTRCTKKQRQTFAEERKEKARRRAEFFAARDAAFERAGLPTPKIEERGGVRIESRGTIAWGGKTISAYPSIRQSVNPQVLH